MRRFPVRGHAHSAAAVWVVYGGLCGSRSLPPSCINTAALHPAASANHTLGALTPCRGVGGSTATTTECGRAGPRLAGVCGRLMSEEELSHRKHTKPTKCVGYYGNSCKSRSSRGDRLTRSCLLVALKTAASLEL